MHQMTTVHATVPESHAPSGRGRGLLVVILLFAVALRVNCLECQSLWLDETISAYRAAIPLQEALRDAADNLHTPGYFVALRGWTALTGLSPFSLRYFSVLSGILLPPAVYAVSRRLSRDSIAAIVATLFVTLSSAHIYYSQETRMYAALPVLYVLMLGLVYQALYRQARVHWALLAILEALALYLHLFSALMLVALNIVLAGAWLWRRWRPSWQYWFASQLVVGLLFTPWLWYAFRVGGAIPANLVNAGSGPSDFSLAAYLQLSWRFLMTGLTETRPFLNYWSGLSAALLLALLLPAYMRATRNGRRALAIALTAVALPLLAGALIWRMNPITHPRYLLFLIGPLAILFGIVTSWLLAHRRRAALAMASCLLLLLLDLSSLHAMRSDAVQQRYDAAALSAAIGRRGDAQDIALMPPGDRSLWYYAPAPVRSANWPLAGGNPQARPAQLAAALEGHDGAFLVEYQDLFSYDMQGQVPFLLEANGRLKEKFAVDRMDVAHYALSDWETPEFSPQDQTCGPFTLTGAHFPQETEPGDAPAIAIRWQLLEETGGRWVASARLRHGRKIVSSADRSLLSASGEYTSRWTAGETHDTYFILPLPLGAVPGSFDVEVLLYEEGSNPLPCGEGGEAAMPLGSVSLVEADQRTVDPYGTWSDTAWQEPAVTEVAPGLALEAYHVRPDSLHPGQPLYVTLRWRATGEIGRTLTPTLQLVMDQTVIDASEGDLFSQYPTSRWQSGDLFIETRELTMPATLDPLRLRIAFDGAGSRLTTIEVDASALDWAVPGEASPQCAFFDGVGYLRAITWVPAQDTSRADATLYWQGAANAPSDMSYTVFAQLLAPDGWVFSQDDGEPADGQRQTITWLPEEVIADTREFALPEDQLGNYRLSVGFYDLATLERVPAYSCEGQRLANDALTIELSTLN